MKHPINGGRISQSVTRRQIHNVNIFKNITLLFTQTRATLLCSWSSWIIITVVAPEVPWLETRPIRYYYDLFIAHRIDHVVTPEGRTKKVHYPSCINVCPLALNIDYNEFALDLDAISARSAVAIWVSPKWFLLNSVNSANHGVSQKWYGYQEKYPTGNMYITSGISKNHISITSLG